MGNYNKPKAYYAYTRIREYPDDEFIMITGEEEKDQMMRDFYCKKYRGYYDNKQYYTIDYVSEKGVECTDYAFLYYRSLGIVKEYSEIDFKTETMYDFHNENIY